MAPTGHGAGVAVAGSELGSAARLLESWRRFVLLLEDDAGRELIGTAEAVEAALARSNLERALEAGDAVDLADLAAADQRYRTLAGHLVASTRVQLYGTDQPVTDWWWRVAELAGEAAPGALVDVATAAQDKGVHPHTVRSAIKTGSLPARRLGRAFLIQRSDLARWQPRPVGRPSATPRRDNDELLAAFNAANTRRHWTRARELARLMAEQPTSARRCLAVALDAFNRGASAEALMWVATALDRGLDDRGRTTAAITACASLTKLGRAEEGLSAIEGVVAPQDLRTAIAAAQIDALLELGELDLARQKATALVERSADSPDGFLLAARVDFHRGDTIEALANILRFRDRDADATEGLMLHGSILGQLGDALGDLRIYEQALGLFRRARRAEQVPATTKIGLCLARLGRWRRALWIAHALHRGGQPDGTTAVLQAALRAAASPDLDDLPTAVDLAERWIGDHPVIALHRAFLLGSRGQWIDASRIINEVPFDGGTDPTELQMLRATALIAANRRDDALAILDPLPLSGTALEVVPDVLRLSRLVNAADDLTELERQDEEREILRTITDRGGLVGMLAGVWLEAEAARERRTVALSPSLLESNRESDDRQMRSLGWDVYHRLNSTPVSRVATMAA